VVSSAAPGGVALLSVDDASGKVAAELKAAGLVQRFERRP
jgi:hypothetical protein